MINVLVTGGEGQLARNIKDIGTNFPSLNMLYESAKSLDITNLGSVENYFNKNNIDYCINCAAYTAVDKAETEKNLAYSINVLGAQNLAKVSRKNQSILIHLSTDFVFDGTKSEAYKETDFTNPQGIYGSTKLAGEKEIEKIFGRYFIIRTSWLYSEHNDNFMKTMLSLAKTRDELRVVDDQIGSPTYAKDLAEVIVRIIDSKNENFGIYHYSNEGVASWYDFAQAIFEENKCEIKLFPIKAKEYPTLAKRPHFSLLDKTKIKETLKIEIPHWRFSLKKASNKIDSQL